MGLKIEKVAILGAGLMGGQIGAHLSNAGIPSMAFDLKQDLAEKGLEAAVGIKPAAFYNPKTVDMIEPLNYDDHIERIKEADWVIEAIAERLDWKQELFEKIAPHLKDDVIISSNTSGLSWAAMAGTLPEKLRSRFFITHFFNPPRYMRLVEFVGGPETDKQMLQDMAAFCDDVLGKGAVWCKDTPNFVANRIGIYGMMLTMKLADEMQLSITDVDKLTGTLIGHPKSATFRTGDVVGLDTLVHVANTAYELGENDEARELFKIPDYLQKLVDEGRLGQKTGEGFYKKISKGVIHELNTKTLEYEPGVKRKFDAVRVSKNETYLPGKFRALVNIDDVAGTFIWELLAGILIYSANRVPEIADDIVNIDNAMKWGFAWEMGPFETWDALGVAETIERMKKESKKAPKWITEMLASGQDSFYGFDGKQKTFYDPGSKSMKPVPVHEKAIDVQIIKKTGGLIKKDWSASLLDIGDGIAMVSTHSVLQPNFNPIDGSILQMYTYAADWVAENDYKGLVIASECTHFSAGANLKFVLKVIDDRDWEKLEGVNRAMQDTFQKLHYAPFPVVAAPHWLALGGGYETIAACDRIVTDAELWTGLVEVGVGLIPSAGGCWRMVTRMTDRMAKGRAGAFPVVQKVFESVGFAKVSTSAKHAVSIGYLTKDDQIVVNGSHRVYEAKQEALAMADGYEPPAPREDIFLPGKGGMLAVKTMIKGFTKAGKISEHDALVAEKLGYVLTGADKGGIMKPIAEQDFLDLEREAFVSLAGEPKTRARIEHTLKTGKPLRN